MEPEGSLPHSQVPATCPYREPARSSPYLQSQFLKIHLNIILSSTSWFTKWSLSLWFLQQNPVYVSPLPHTRYMPRPWISMSKKRNFHSSSLRCLWVQQRESTVVAKCKYLTLQQMCLELGLLQNSLLIPFLLFYFKHSIWFSNFCKINSNFWSLAANAFHFPNISHIAHRVSPLMTYQ